MLTPDKLHSYQQKAVNFQCTRPHSMLWLDMGLGKTVITLTSIAHLLNSGFLRGVVIVAPIRVITLVWRQEAEKWAHTHGLRFSMVKGNRDQRTRALLRPADVYLINYENLEWLAQTIKTYFVSKNKPLPFDGIVWDEISKMKNSATNRVRAFRKISDQFKWTTGLTGTPASNGYKDLHGQFLVVDGGQRLGTSKTAFKTKFYKKVGPYKEVPYQDTEETIKNLIGDITLEMSAADYNPLPDLIVNDVEIDFPANIRAKYEQLEKEFFLALESGKTVEAFNQASLTNKCLAERTEVLTHKGWKYIEDINESDLVWDGVEWVSVSGVVCNGYKSVIECWGVSMTPDHKVLTDRGWREAQEVLDGESGERFDRAAVRTPFSPYERGEQDNIWDIGARNVASSMRLRERVGFAGSKSQIETSDKTQILRVQTRGDNRYSRDDRNPTLGDLVQHAVAMQQGLRQRLAELRWSWDQSVSRMGRVIREVLGGYVTGVFGRVDNRADRRERSLLERELPMGDQTRAGEQHTIQRSHSNMVGTNDNRSSCKNIRIETNHDLQKEREGLVERRSNKARVYDIINAGPRHRFTVRGRNGEVFIAHNCLQFSNGSIYPIGGLPLWEPIHDLKLIALEEIIDEAQGSPIFCSYAYRSDAERIMKRFAKLDPINLTDCKTESALKNAMHRWKSGKCQLMIAHPASAGHGIDGLQKNGRHVVWFGLNWSLDLYEQMNARIRRQGQGAPVICHRILSKNTLDQAQAMALDDKANTQAGLRNALKHYRTMKGF